MGITLFQVVKSMGVKIQPPERIAISPYEFNGWKPEQINKLNDNSSLGGYFITMASEFKNQSITWDLIIDRLRKTPSDGNFLEIEPYVWTLRQFKMWGKNKWLIRSAFIFKA